MARGINKVILVGHLGQDPEVRYLPSGGAITTISIATTESWKDKQTGQLQERTEWHRVVLFNRLAEIAGEYLKKGSHVYIEGKLQTRKWQDQNGQDRYTTEIVASEMQMLGGRAGMGGEQGYGSGGAAQSYGQPQQPSQQQPQQQAQQQYQPQHQHQSQQPAAASQPSAPAPQPQAMDSFDDDIPF